MALPFLSATPQAIGTDRVYRIQLNVPGVFPLTPITTFTTADIPSCVVWPGQGYAPTCAPAVAWATDGSDGTLLLTVSAANTATIGSPGNTRLKVTIAVGGSAPVVEAWDGWLAIEESAGTVAVPLTYCVLDDLLLYAPWLPKLQADSDDVGFLAQRVRATQKLQHQIARMEHAARFYRPLASLRIPPPGQGLALAAGGTGGTLAAGAYYGTYTFQTLGQGETEPGQLAGPFTLAAGQVFTASGWPAPLPAGVASVNVYLGSANGTEDALILAAAGVVGTSATIGAPPSAVVPLSPPDFTPPTGAYEPPASNRDLADTRVQRERRAMLIQSYLTAGRLMLDGSQGSDIVEAVAREAIALVCDCQVGATTGANPFTAQAAENRRLAREARNRIRARIDADGDGQPDIVISLSEAWVA